MGGVGVTGNIKVKAVEWGWGLGGGGEVTRNITFNNRNTQTEEI